MSTAEEITARHYLKSRCYKSSRVRIKNYDFVTTDDVTFVTDLDDYTILSNFDIDKFIKNDTVAMVRRNKGLKKQSTKDDAAEDG